MKICTVIQTIDNKVSTSYYLNRRIAQGIFNDLVKSVGANYTTILMQEIDTDSLKGTLLDSFEGTEVDD